MFKTIKKVKGAFGNRITFYTTDLLSSNQIVVRDEDCQIERIYTVGRVQELDNFEMVEIKSKAQVMRAWENGTARF